MLRRPPRATRTDTLFPYTPLFRSWRAMWITLSAILLLAWTALTLGADYHVLGTDRTGNDVLWQCLKSIRPALVIGTLTTLAMLPPALGFGIAAGYFKGRVDRSEGRRVGKECVCTCRSRWSPYN